MHNYKTLKQIFVIIVVVQLKNEHRSTFLQKYSCIMVSHMMQKLKKYNAFALKTRFEYNIGLDFKFLKTDKVT